jgi:hypothetical protein
MEFEEFPKLSLTDLYHITLGTYQMKQSISYIAQNLDEKGIYTFQAVRDKDITRVQLLSRHDLKMKLIIT